MTHISLLSMCWHILHDRDFFDVLFMTTNATTRTKQTVFFLVISKMCILIWSITIQIEITQATTHLVLFLQQTLNLFAVGLISFKSLMKNSSLLLLQPPLWPAAIGKNVSRVNYCVVSRQKCGWCYHHTLFFIIFLISIHVIFEF